MRPQGVGALISALVARVLGKEIEELRCALKAPNTHEENSMIDAKGRLLQQARGAL